MVKMRSPIHKNAIAHQPKNAIAGPQKPGFFRNTSLQPTDLDKNPVSLLGGGAPETGFLRQFFVTATDSGKNPVSWIAGGRGLRNRVFSEILRYNPQMRTKTRFLRSSPAANSLQSQEMHPARSIARYNCHPIRRNCTAMKLIISAETSNLFATKQIPDF